MSETIFTKIISKELPSDIVHEDDLCLAFKDINPVAPVHILIIPKKAIATTNDIGNEDKELVGHIHLVAAAIAKKHDFAEAGFRLVMNCNRDGGQEVYHIHWHLIAGVHLGWPPFPNSQNDQAHKK